MTDKPWTVEETETLAEMMAEGNGYGKIALALGRSKSSVVSRFHKMRRAIGWQAR